MFGLDQFDFDVVWRPMYVFLTIAVIIGYLYLVGPWREKHYPGEPPVKLTKKVLFIVAAILYYLTNGGPSSLLGHIYFTFHMVNMALSYLIVPPLVLAAVPGFIWKKVFSRPFWKPFKFLTHPIAALILFNMSFSIYHIPFIHDYVMTHFTVHRLYYFMMLVFAFLMWQHVISPVEEWIRLSYVKRMAFIFANGVLLTPACALIIFANEPLFAIYNDPEIWVKAMGYCIPGDTSYLLTQFEGGPLFFNMFSVLEDQQMGGIIMKLLQEFMYGVLLAILFKEWYRKEYNSSEENDKKTQQAIERLALERQ